MTATSDSLAAANPWNLTIGAWLVAASLCFLVLMGQSASAANCGGSVPPPLLTVRTDIRPAIQDLTRGIRQLTSSPNLAVPRDLDGFGYAVGATAAMPRDRTTWEGRGEQMSDGRWCWTVTKIQVVITVATTVYIAKEVPRGSCLWNEVAKHEAKHVRIDQRLFPQLAGLVRPKMQRAVSRSIPALSETEAKAILAQRISQAMTEAAEAFERSRNAEQLKIDTREEYTRPNKICGDAEILAALKRAGLR